MDSFVGGGINTVRKSMRRKRKCAREILISLIVQQRRVASAARMVPMGDWPMQACNHCRGLWIGFVQENSLLLRTSGSENIVALKSSNS